MAESAMMDSKVKPGENDMNKKKMVGDGDSVDGKRTFQVKIGDTQKKYDFTDDTARTTIKTALNDGKTPVDGYQPGTKGHEIAKLKYAALLQDGGGKMTQATAETWAEKAYEQNVKTGRTPAPTSK